MEILALVPLRMINSLWDYLFKISIIDEEKN
jgi:hypothetical protein